MKLNRFIDNQVAHIKKSQAYPLTGFTNQVGQPASWDDAGWTFTYPDGKRINYFFTNEKVKSANIKSIYSDDKVLASNLRHLLMAYTLDINTENSSIVTKRKKIQVARQLLGITGNPANITKKELDNAVNKLLSPKSLPVFFHWLYAHFFIQPSLKLPVIESETREAGDDILDKKKTKIPNEKTLLALGAITHDVISQDPDKWNTSATNNQRDTFICTMSALALSSPNRVAAEQTVLQKQQLKSINQIVDGKKQCTYYLDWQGSKGFKNNKNHILSSMADTVSRCLKYTNIITEPARVLARFYANPTLPLKKILGDFCPSDKNLKALIPNMDKPLHLIHLGYLLGFFDSDDGMLRVTSNTSGAFRAKSKRGASSYVKNIIDIQEKDHLKLASNCLYTLSLMGMAVNSDLLKAVFGGYPITVKDFQKRWIKHIYERLPGFPAAHNMTKEGHTDYRYGLFSFLGRQMISGRAGYMGGMSHFALVPISSLSRMFTEGISTNSQLQNIFIRKGFSKDFGINAHQFRHWLNDIAEREGVPHSIINLWSGRKTPEQILHYVHRTHNDKSSEISDILFQDDVQEISIKLMGQQEYEKAVNTATTVTSVGFCSQDLVYSPCEYLNNFVTQCSLCPSSCHIAHDKESIALLKKDLQVQERRLDNVQNRENFDCNRGLQDWFSLHYSNTTILRDLVQILESKDTEEGSIVRYLFNKQEVRITNVRNKTVEKRTIALPNTEDVLAKLLEVKSKPSQVKNMLADMLNII
ncbi:MAG: hypothetical protein ACJAZP_002382 [Psychromonas sp.]|jgi:hypothetical protein|uniref:hypothetical protein n=1 Tax=Psychromonas sp. TaxID=1884585 RepID=UPI0039E665C5